MQHRPDPDSPAARQRDRSSVAAERQPYVVPVLEHLGSWRALTLEQSVGIALLRALIDDGWLDDYR